MLTKINLFKSFLMVLLFSLTLLFVPKVHAIEYGMLGGKPANPDPAVADSSSWFIYKLAPGEKKQDSLLVMNLYEKQSDVLVYPADGTKSSGGGFALKQFLEAKEEVGAWVKFYPEAVPAIFQNVFDAKNGSIIDFCGLSDDQLQTETGKKKLSVEDFALRQTWCQGVDQVKLSLAAKENKKIPFVFAVPENANVGEHTGGILIQKAEAEDTGTEQQGSAVKLTTRVGVRIYETVPGQVVKNLVFSNFQIVKNYKELNFGRWFEKTPKSEDFLVQGDITNSGNVSVDFQNIISVKDELFGKRTQEVVDRNFQVLKDDTFISNYSWEGPRFGKFTFSMGLKYTDDQGKEQITTSNPITIWIFPWREIIAVLFFSLIFVGAFFARKTYLKKKYGGIGWVEYAVKKTDTIAKISQKYDVDWSVLVRTNKMKPPFLLEAGMVILVPADKNGVDVIAKVSKTEIAAKKKATQKSKVAVKAKSTVKTLKKSEPKAVLVAPVEKHFNKKYPFWILGIVFLLLIVIAGSFLTKKEKAKEVSSKISISSIGSASNQEVEVAPKEKVAEEVASIVLKKDTGAVLILNGGAKAGTAGKLSDFFKEKGIDQVETKNAELDTHTGVVVYYQDEYEPFANRIMNALKLKYADAKLEIAKDAEQKSEAVVVVLGK